MTAALGDIGRPLVVFDVTNVTFRRRADGQGVTSTWWMAMTPPTRQSRVVLSPHGVCLMWPLAPRRNGSSAAPMSPAEDVRRIAGAVLEAWTITATRGKYGRGLRPTSTARLCNSPATLNPEPYRVQLRPGLGQPNEQRIM